MNFHNCTIANESVEEYLQHLQDKTNLTLIPAVVMLSIFAVTGLIGNVLVLVVYSKKFRLNPTKVLIMTIASFDLVANIGAIPSEVNIMFDSWNFKSPGVCKSKVFLGAFTVVGGAISLVAVAVVRYRKVCHPHEWQVTIKQAIFASLGAASISFLVSIPYIIIYGIKTKKTPCVGIKGYECFADDHYFYTIWPLMNNLLFIFLFVCLSFSIVILYILIGVTAWKHSKQRSLIKQSNRRGEINSANTGINDDQAKSKSLRRESEPSSLNMRESVKDVQQLVTNGASKNSLRPLFCCMGQRESRISANTNQTFVVMNSFTSTNDTDTNELSISKDVNQDDICLEEISSGGEITYKVTNSENTGHKKEILGDNQDKNSKILEKGESPLNMSSVLSQPVNKLTRDRNDLISNNKDQPNINNAQYERDTPIASNYENEKCADDQNKNESKNDFNKQQTIKKRKSLGKKRKTDTKKSLNRMTIMLIIISAIYVFGFIPFLALTIIKNRRPQLYASLNMAELSVYNFFYRLYFVNTAANPIIYSLCNISFRRACLRLFTCKSRRRL